MVDAGFVTAVLAGLTGSLHCLAMCGGYVALTGSRSVQPLRPARALRMERLAAHAGRLSTYLLLGAAFGAAGGAALALDWPAAQRVLYGIANGVLLVTALRIARPLTAMAALERAGLALFRQAAPLARSFIAAPGWPGRFVLGLLWGMTPCALIYGLLPVALLSGNAWSGATVMLGLWLGTLPALTLAGGLAGRLGTGRTRTAAAVVIAAFALIGLYRVVFLPGTLASGPFCTLL
ncbi:MAG TPA: sulfite exporter TauE/SafE family protein [Casimicrobiaceae bacterium]|nr:sulfite exporter TauE/SafE family protein [Casimicrobiaceae bacterium]